LSRRVIDLGFLSDQDRNDAFSAAAVYLQPSKMESFSRSVMEAWLAGTPVLATADGEVVAWHCERSGGGITFHDAQDLASALQTTCGPTNTASAMASKGREYVLREYSWPVVLDRMEAELESPAWQR
jgi:glycosyltransferase involved in cell wall biosynthesis